MIYHLEETGKALLRETREYSDLEELLTEEFGSRTAWILFWEQYRTDFAWFDGKEILWPEGKAAKNSYLLEARVFSKTKEVYVRNVGNKKLAGRLLEEEKTGAEADASILETDMLYTKVQEPYMWGSIVDKDCIREERGMEYHLPFTVDTGEIQFGYQVMQYYQPDSEDGMLHLLDYRLSGVYQQVDGRKLFLNGGGIEDDRVY